MLTATAMDTTQVEGALVRERMSAPVAFVEPDVPLAALVGAVEARGVSALPVVEGGALLGIVSTTDLVRATAAPAEPAPRARDLMRHPVRTIAPDRPVTEAAAMLIEHRVHRLVVVEGGRPIGMLAARDLLGDVKATGAREPLSSFMTEEVRSLEIGDSIGRAVAELADANVHGLVVIEGTSPVGVFTHAEALAARKLPPSLRERPVEDVMSYETICLDADTPIARAAAYAAAMDVRRILVVARRQLVGIASALDMLRPLAAGARSA